MDNLIPTLAMVVSSSLLYSTPLILTALGGTFSERSGVVNVGLEGTMVVGAFASILFNLGTSEFLGAWTPWVAVLVGALAGCAFSLIHAMATVHLRANHIISGTVLNMLAPALCLFLTKVIFEGKGQSPIIMRPFGISNIPILSEIPVIGQIFFKGTSLPAWFAIAIAFLCHFVLFNTTFGLRLRSVGEHPEASDSLGINVYQMKYAGVLLSGVLGGLGGAILANSISLNFSGSTIAGQGFIAMAAMIFGKWRPISVMLSSIFFGFAQSLAIVGSYVPIIQNVPSVFLQILPYVLTIIVLVAFVGQSQGPKANGQTYIKVK